jgi:hypothetical protein
MTWRVISCATALAVLATEPATAQNAAAILIGAEGVLAPPLQAGAEVPAGTSLALGDAGTATLVHYRTCHLVALRGGSIKVDEMTYWISGGVVLQEETVSCPGGARTGMRRQGEAGGTAGMTLRGLSAQFVQERPAVIVIGRIADAIDKVSFLAEDKAVVDIPLARGRGTWPHEAPALAASRAYVARFHRRDGPPIDVKVIVDAALKSDGQLPALFFLE